MTMPLFLHDLDELPDHGFPEMIKGFTSSCHPHTGWHMFLSERPGVDGGPERMVLRLACSVCGADGPVFALYAEGIHADVCHCDTALWDVGYFEGELHVRCHACMEPTMALAVAPNTPDWDAGEDEA